MRILKGDATSPQAKGPKIVAHVCNDIGGWGSGFVVAVSKRWKEPERDYRQWHRQRAANDFGLGAVRLVQAQPDIWVDEAGVTIEDLLVSVADTVWKGKRVKELEQLVVDRLVVACGMPAWEAFMALDDMLAALAGGSDRRLAFQFSHGLEVAPQKAGGDHLGEVVD